MKKILCIAFMLFGMIQLSQAQKKDWALGLRVGEPTGLNIKKYLGGKNALEFNIGSNGWGYSRGRRYWKGEFRRSLVIGANYLWQLSAGNTQGLDLYFGFGGQLSSRRYWDRDINREENALGVGVTGVFGLEYFISASPVSIFLDFGPYIELAPAAGWAWIDAALGVRFNL
ncbi:hypothetical protein [Microscilla marina]|uniref:Outer membrane protein beta-barrel domain-containing protein n=1 Tax=Microscilla marina ATCC 23134 TaxID=313606 RepID=A1ZRF2_MICM2|nr:hypothetical protein [Microscilla marina]EAY27042.1 hypothetical protein M23134_04730 [Microscilla marina ATCC 23134]